MRTTDVMLASGMEHQDGISAAVQTTKTAGLESSGPAVFVAISLLRRCLGLLAGVVRLAADAAEIFADVFQARLTKLGPGVDTGAERLLGELEPEPLGRRGLLGQLAKEIAGGLI